MTITTANFETEVLQSPVPVLLEFWAPWCGPCKMLGSFIGELEQEYAGRVKIGKVNVDEEGPLAEQHGISTVPALAAYDKGVIVRQQAGALPKTQIENLIKDIL